MTALFRSLVVGILVFGLWAGWDKLFPPSAGDVFNIPTEVHNAANHEAWLQTRQESGDLQPAECNRLSETSYRCMAQVLSPEGAPRLQVQMDVEHYSSGAVTLSNVLRRAVTTK